MTSSAAPPASLPFFLPASSGQRFCLYHAPAAATPIRAAVLYAHPFAEEMNRSRRIAALQARAFAAAGIAVLQIDLHGCGDSSGDFADARWENWKNDLALAHAWLAEKTSVPVALWGLRLGALLMLDYARQASRPVDRFILWQPVTNGKAWLTQWLRLRLASDMLGESSQDQAGGTGGTQALRAALARGDCLEIAGYELAPELAAAIDALDSATVAPFGQIVNRVIEQTVEQAVDWFDIVGSADKPMLPATGKIITQWREQTTVVQQRPQELPPSIRHHQIVGQNFWALPEITACPALIEATLAALHASDDAGDDAGNDAIDGAGHDVGTT